MIVFMTTMVVCVVALGMYGYASMLRIGPDTPRREYAVQEKTPVNDYIITVGDLHGNQHEIRFRGTEDGLLEKVCKIEEQKKICIGDEEMNMEIPVDIGTIDMKLLD